MKKQDFIDTISELFLQNKDNLNINKFMTIEDILKQASLDIIMKYPSKYDDWTNYVTPDTPNLEQFTIEKCKSLLASRKDFLDEFKRVKNNGEKLSDFKNIYATKETELLKNIPAFIIAKFGYDRKELAFGIFKNVLSQSERLHPISTQNYFDENNEIGQWIKNNGFMDDFIAWGQNRFFSKSNNYYLFQSFAEQTPIKKISSFGAMELMIYYELYQYEVNMKAVLKSSFESIYLPKELQPLVEHFETSQFWISKDKEEKKRNLYAEVIALFYQKELLEPNNVKINGKVKFEQRHEELLNSLDMHGLINKFSLKQERRMKVEL